MVNQSSNISQQSIHGFWIDVGFLGANLAPEWLWSSAKQLIEIE